MASQERETSLIRLLGEDIDIVSDVMRRYETLCMYLGWHPRPEWAGVRVREYTDNLELALAALGDSDAYDLYPDAPSAHRYLAALATVMEALRYCGGAPELGWLCRVADRLAASIGWFAVHGAAAPIAGAVCDALPQLCDP